MSLSENQAPEITTSFADDAVLKQRRQMLIALTLLLMALIMVLIKDREFWFPSAPVSQATSEPIEEPSSEPLAQSEAVTSPKQTTGITTLKARRTKPITSAQAGQASTAAPVVVSRTMLLPCKLRLSLETSTAPYKPAAIPYNWTCSRLPLPARRCQCHRHQMQPG